MSDKHNKTQTEVQIFQSKIFLLDCALFFAISIGMDIEELHDVNLTVFRSRLQCFNSFEVPLFKLPPPLHAIVKT